MDDLENINKARVSKRDRWASVSAVPQAGENTDTPVESRAKWSKIYAKFGATGETQQDEVFAAVNLYFLRNGASPKGKYAKPIRTAGGSEVSAGEVVKLIGNQEGEIRQFLRGRLEDSYNFLKYNPAIANDDALVTKAQNCGVPQTQAWLLADWLGADCQYFVSDEANVYNILRTSKIANAYAKDAVDPGKRDVVRENAPETKVAAARVERAASNSMFSTY